MHVFRFSIINLLKCWAYEYMKFLNPTYESHNNYGKLYSDFCKLCTKWSSNVSKLAIIIITHKIIIYNKSCHWWTLPSLTLWCSPLVLLLDCVTCCSGSGMSPEWHRGLVCNTSVCSEKAIIMMTFSTPGFTTSVNLNLFVFFGDLYVTGYRPSL